MSATFVRRWIALAAVAALSLAACSTSSSKSTSSKNTGGGGSQSTALGKGVSANAIKIGFSYIDLETLAKSGIIKIDNGPYEQVIKALVDDVNAQGGINGRKLQLFTAKYSPIGNADQLAACTKLTEDDGVFVVLNGLLQANNLCIVQQHATPLIGDYVTEALRAKAKAPWVTWSASDDRTARALVTLMDQNGYLKGHKVAVYAENLVNKSLVDETVAALEAAGTPAVDTAIFEVPGADTQAASKQDKIIAQRFQNKGVDTVINVGLFTPGADWDADGFHPAMFGLSTGTLGAAAYTNPLDKFPIVAGTEASADPDAGFNTPAMARCRNIWKHATGKEIVDAAQENKLGHSTGATAMSVACAAMQIFVEAAKAAGPNLNQETFQKGVESIGPIALPTTPVASFGPAKLDGQDTFQLAKFNTAWKPNTSVQQFLPVGKPITMTK
jgi:ABC-type branched-subunit amino acid transport system substrate-binding protein